MENLKNRLKKADGFTLVELLVVIAIIAILSVTAYVALGGQTGKARDSRRQSDLSAVQSALEIYFINNNNQYPDLLTDLNAKEMPEIPEDPWGPTFSYEYAVNGTNKQYQLATTAEGDEGLFEAYVIGNSTSDIIGAGVLQDESPCLAVIDKGTCLPYTL